MACAGVTAAAEPVFATDDGAIRGYDPVAYFTKQEALKGRPEFTYHYRGADWYFISQAHLDQFKNHPQRYVPQYGGYCAFGMSHGEKATIDPKAFDIVNRKLYLNNSFMVRDFWRADRAKRIEQADQHWIKF